MTVTAFAQTDHLKQQVEDKSTTIKFRHVTFDPLVNQQHKQLSSRLKAKVGVEDKEDKFGCYLVQFHGQARQQYQQGIRALGAEIRAHIPSHTVVACMTSQIRQRIDALPYVRWTGDFDASHKIESELIDEVLEGGKQGERQRFSILLHSASDAMRRAVTARIGELGGEVHRAGGRMIEATLDYQSLVGVAAMHEVFYVDKWSPEAEDVDQVRAAEVGGFNFVETAAGYTGQGVRGEVRDRGLRITHQDFQARPPIEHGSFNETDPSHGTQVYGIVFGDGTGNAKARGLLPDAQGIFSSRFFDRDDVTELGELVDPAGLFRAVFQTNSFGSSETPSYTSSSFERDDAIFQHDIVVTQSMGNTKSRVARPQGWAKNGVSVGGIRSRDTLTRNDDSWDRGTGSIGPAADGRVKPELSYFNRDVYATTHTDNSAYTDDFGGTSAATPIVAGHFGLLFQMWADGVFDPAGPGQARDVFDSRPHAATARALMINTAFQYPFIGLGHDKSRFHQGWGTPNVKNLYEIAQSHSWTLPVLIDESAPLAPSQTHQYTMGSDGSQPLKVTLVYKDPPGAPAVTQHRVNDLSLRVTSPSNVVYWGNYGLMLNPWSVSGGSEDTINTVENVFVRYPEPGTWTVEVLGTEIIQDTHDATPEIDAVYALVGTGGVDGTTGDFVLESRIAASSDDVEELPDGTVLLNNANNDIELGEGAGGQHIVGLRFTDITVPAGATITRAYIQFEADETDSTVAMYTIEGENSDNAATFSTAGNDVSSRARTTATVNWAPPSWVSSNEQGLDQRTPDLAGIVQEVVSRPGWASGNALSFIISGTGLREIESFDGDTPNAALLHIEYDDGTTPTPVNEPPMVLAGEEQLVSLSTGASLEGLTFDDGLPTPGNVTVTWSAEEGTGTVMFADESALQTSATFSLAGVYRLRLTATDGELEAFSEVLIEVVQGEILNVRVNSSEDDAEEMATATSLTSGDLELVEISSGPQTVGMIFRGIGIPRGSVIDRAFIQFQADETDDVATSLTIAGESSDNPSAFEATAGNISSRPRTAATVAWNNIPDWGEGQAGADQRTPDVRNIVQEIVDRPGWASGNALGIIITGTGTRTAESFEGNADAAPLLFVVYEPGQPADASQTTVTQTGSMSPIANGVDSTTFVFQLRNAAGEPLAFGGDTVTVTTGSSATVSAPVDNGDGTYSVTVTNTMAELVTLSLEVNGGVQTDAASVTFVTPMPEATQTTVEQSGTTSPMANGVDSTTFTFQLRDSLGEPLTVGGDTVTVTTGSSATVGAAVDNGDGTYNVTVTNTVAEQVTLSLEVNGGVQTNAASVTFVAPVAVASETTVTRTGSGSPVADGRDSATFTFQLRDSFGEPLTVGGDTVTVTTASRATVGAAVDNGDGTYRVTVTSTVAESVSLSLTVNGSTQTGVASVTFAAPPGGGGGIGMLLLALLAVIAIHRRRFIQ